MPSSGVSKSTNAKPDNIEKLRKVAEDKSLSPQKLESGKQQALVSDASPNMNMKKPYPDENEAEQTQQNASVDDNPTPPCDRAIPSIEKNDIEMTDFGRNRETEDQQHPTQNGTLGAQNDTDHSDLR